MVTKSTDSTSKPRKHGELTKDAAGNLAVKLNKLKKKIQAERTVSIQEKLRRNGDNIQRQVSTVMSAISRRDSSQTEQNRTNQMASGINHPSSKFPGFSQSSGEKGHINDQDAMPTTTIKIPYIEKLPTYITWMNLARNERMTEDQSVVGRRRIYYEKHGGEALVCSDSEDESTEPEEVKEAKHDFSEGEDRLLWMAFEEHGSTEEVLNIVSQFVGGTSSEIQGRYKLLKEKNMERKDQHSADFGGYESHTGICLEKSLNAALDSFDKFFCRRCMQLLNCPLHGCSQPLIYPSEKQPVWSETERERKPCSNQCYLKKLKDVNIMSEDSIPGSFQDKKTSTMKWRDGLLAPSSAEEPGNHSAKAVSQGKKHNYVTTLFTTEDDCCRDLKSNVPVSESIGKRKVKDQSDSTLCYSTMPPDDSQTYCKKVKRISDDIVTVSSNFIRDLNLDADHEVKNRITSASLGSSVEHTSHKLLVCHGKHDKDVGDGQRSAADETEFKQSTKTMKKKDVKIKGFSDWKPLEKELYLKGVEMFGRDSCLIARNLLSGLKTCMEVASYMHADGVSKTHGSIASSSPIMDKNGKIKAQRKGHGMRIRSRVRRKRRAGLRYCWKPVALPSVWRRIAGGENPLSKQYTPCECQGKCGIRCSCHRNGTCCEKYCGCSKLCRNRFRGCHCAKSQCRTRQCPCFAAGRECDPDVCRNCWISCGDGSLGEPPRQGESQCGNMRLLLRQQQRILLGKSDVTGWGAFLKNPVNKDDFLGEYTGELISHTEADKRGKIYDRANLSFLFDLNDKLVLDAYRKGDKLKFANHSSTPNCYAKVMLVAGDHRVAIFAKERIEAGEELFYDYRYGPEIAPQWALKIERVRRGRYLRGASQRKAKKRHSR